MRSRERMDEISVPMNDGICPATDVEESFIDIGAN
jgi:hypothetical protein